MQTAIHPHGPMAIANQNKFDTDFITPVPVHRTTDSLIHYLIDLI
jgi:hypothetical protein